MCSVVWPYVVYAVKCVVEWLCRVLWCLAVAICVVEVWHDGGLMWCAPDGGGIICTITTIHTTPLTPQHN